jgi:hypothetical protein
MSPVTNLGKWDRWYALLGDDPSPQPYAQTITYELGVAWLDDCETVEDWGCGKGWLRTLIRPDRYRGIDGSASPFADEIVDLADYRSSVPGVFMRHVIEHDMRWKEILANALASFTHRMVLILFTPLVEQTHDIAWEADPGVPNLAFALDDLTTVFAEPDGVSWHHETLATTSQFETETIFYLQR